MKIRMVNSGLKGLKWVTISNIHKGTIRIETYGNLADLMLICLSNVLVCMTNKKADNGYVRD